MLALSACSFDASKLRYGRDAGVDQVVNADTTVGNDRDGTTVAADTKSGVDTVPFADGRLPTDVADARMAEDTEGKSDLSQGALDSADDGTSVSVDGEVEPPVDAEGPEYDANLGSPDAVPVVDVASDTLIPDTTPPSPDTAPDTLAPDTAPLIDPDLVVWYRFDETSGSTAYDSAKFGGVARNATLVASSMYSSATFTAQSKVGARALSLQPSTFYPSMYGAYANLPVVHTLAPNEMTIAVWVYMPNVGSSQTWARIWDFGTTTTTPNWLNLVARDEQGMVRFAMSNTGHDDNQQQRLISSTPLKANTWQHVALVFPPGATYTGVMYIDGEVVATNTKMTLHGADIAATSNNCLGKSLFSSDPYFNGSLDDFRVYKRALSREEIVALMAVR